MNRLYSSAMECTTPDNVEWVRRKSNVVARFLHSSYVAGLKEKIKNQSLIESQGLALSDYATHGGSFPLAVTGAGVVGSVTVSGAPDLVTRAGIVSIRVPALGVRKRQPAREARQIAILSRPKDKMPMIRHQRICENTH